MSKSRLVAHRGNINGAKPEVENLPQYILAALNEGFSVEADFRMIYNFLDNEDADAQIYWGHDKPDYQSPVSFGDDLVAAVQNTDKLVYLHAKDPVTFVSHAKAFPEIFPFSIDLFYNEADAVTMTLNGKFWIHPAFDSKFELQILGAIDENFVFVLDEDQKDLAKYLLKYTEASVCCDYVGELVDYV